MRIFFASDLHIDARRSGRRATRRMADWLARHGRERDVLILGGDYGNDDKVILECLEMFQRFPGDVLAVAGNHDVWGTPEEDSWSRYHRRLPELFASFGFHALECEPAVVGDVGFAGAMGWYDYSLRDPALDVDMEVYRQKRLPWTDEPVWRDARYIDWPPSDEEMTDLQLKRLQAQLEMLEGSVDEIVVALHHVPTEALLRPELLPEGVPRRAMVPERWLVLNTYLGSERFSEMLASYSARIDLVACGHIHLGRRAVKDGMTFASNGSDYERKELIVYEGGELRRLTFEERASEA